jgi:hypothetical protein
MMKLKVGGAEQNVVIGGWSEYEVIKRKYRYSDREYVGRGYGEMVSPEDIVNDIMLQQHPDHIMSPFVTKFSQLVSHLEDIMHGIDTVKLDQLHIPSIPKTFVEDMSKLPFLKRVEMIEDAFHTTAPRLPDFDLVPRAMIQELEEKLIPYMNSMEEWMIKIE